MSAVLDHLQTTQDWQTKETNDCLRLDLVGWPVLAAATTQVSCAPKQQILGLNILSGISLFQGNPRDFPVFKTGFVSPPETTKVSI